MLACMWQQWAEKCWRDKLASRYHEEVRVLCMRACRSTHAHAHTHVQLQKMRAYVDTQCVTTAQVFFCTFALVAHCKNVISLPCLSDISTIVKGQVPGVTSPARPAAGMHTCNARMHTRMHACMRPLRHSTTPHATPRACMRSYTHTDARMHLYVEEAHRTRTQPIQAWPYRSKTRMQLCRPRTRHGWQN